MEADPGHFLDRDIAPFIFSQASNVAEGELLRGVVLRQVPGAGTEGMEELHHDELVVGGFLGIERIVGKTC